MIILAVQLRIFVLCIVGGWMYGMLFTFVDLLFNRRKVVICMYDIFFHIGMFYLLYILNGGLLRAYYVLLFIAGYVLYEYLYYPQVIPLFIQCIYYVKIPINRFLLVFSQFISIIKMLMKRENRKMGMHSDTSSKEKSR